MMEPAKLKSQKKQAKKVTTEDKVKSYLPFRFYWVYFTIAVMVFGLIGKVAYIQLVDSKRLIEEANDRSIRTQQIHFTRGRILDRNHRLISVSDPRYSITLDPKLYFETQIKRSRSRWKILAMETGRSASEIQANLSRFLKSKKKPKYNPRMILNPKSDKYWTLLSQVTGLDYNLLLTKVHNNPYSEFVRLDKEAAKIEKIKWQALAKNLGQTYRHLMAKIYKYSQRRFAYIARHRSEEIGNYAKELKINALVLKTEYLRVYPLAEAVSQLVGFTDMNDEHGIEGLERSFDSLLIGKDGKKVIRKDFRGNVIEHIRDEKQYDPQDVVLSIDEELQTMTYREIKKAVIEQKAKSGTAVLVDIHTGEVLAMANAPSFNPNNRKEYKSSLARNRAITDTFEPGSTVKPFVVLTALQNGVTYKDEVINTRPFKVNGHTIRDVAPRDQLSIEGILQKSSNVGVSRLALRMSPATLMSTYSKVGFGKKTNLGLGERRGTNGERSRWSDIERATVAYGYGLEVTPLQLARAYATLGSFGIYRPLSITKVIPPIIGERVLSEKTTKDVVKMMESVARQGGGGVKAAVDGYRVAVKTGTAKKIENKKYVDKYIAYTAGVAPASNPRFALVVLINEPRGKKYYGGAISAPVFSKIMGYTLKERNVKPDNLGNEEK
ncbi:penicillin-binding transpeptidase domain-containing protein [Pasteurella skyensis]|uniref:Peptidoglycan D,D-transpeptidase FtsI n=1 Tax=Phocoenobacter skyensis TaxID=97481 RepID=A0AAJ6NB70_9PAST|nr:penicillin-binding transpeptidase domain-containing protein [Pasteurella skyensis]MDP8163050.1 penicillin-binding transpeptidase domain-containing protein [Pasteurella skyensis]MDP8173570.1 penicillin-binding transpeptidase domain-containing protein [Pasteurella skyensis]MDP8176312.1 penicillin-binding transpeptidase domain-containing protein [Pasteurella skyensis]MDP8178977.1 penicillin-binding transpeptidase domain-containing protein [Pasteurella skyensis]MDP8183747.1 penicillin-binding t